MGAQAEADADVMRVSATTPPQAVASSINKAILQNQSPVIRAVGAGATAQACKGIAIARGLIAVRGRDLMTTIGFDTIIGDTGDEISAQTFHLFLR